MGPQIIASAHARFEIPKLHKIGLEYAVLETGVCFGILNGMKGQIIQRKSTIRGIELILNIFCEWLYPRKGCEK